ncbi:unnamed protein product [Closterium sp. NIES-64]|nr:unnamed protein product [Closterium sp. NIES-64]
MGSRNHRPRFAEWECLLRFTAWDYLWVGLAAAALLDCVNTYSSPPFRPLPPPFRPLPPPPPPLFPPLPSALFPLPSALFPLPSALFPLPSALFPLPSALFPLPSALFPLPSALFPSLPPSFPSLPPSSPPFRPLPLPSALFPSPLPQRFTEWEYLWVGLAAALPCVLVPPFMLCAADKGRPWHEQHWVKANVWIAIFSFVGNYFWTHYFYTLLGASYTFPSWRLNDVPFALYLLTHAYFCFYHVISNITIRRLRHFLNTPSSTPQPASAKHYVNSKSSSAKSKPSTSSASSATRSSVFSLIVQGAWVLALSYITAFMETATIANFEYYTFVDKAAMYRVGTLFYALYFVVSFPFFFRIDEDPSDSWPLSRVPVDSLKAIMLVTTPKPAEFTSSSSPPNLSSPLLFTSLILTLFLRIDEDPSDSRPLSRVSIDEDTSDSWPLSRVAVDSLGASMLVTILLDIWRLVIGPITQLPQTNTCASGLPWMG